MPETNTGIIIKNGVIYENTETITYSIYSNESPDGVSLSYQGDPLREGCIYSVEMTEENGVQVSNLTIVDGVTESGLIIVNGIEQGNVADLPVNDTLALEDGNLTRPDANAQEEGQATLYPESTPSPTEKIEETNLAGDEGEFALSYDLADYPLIRYSWATEFGQPVVLTYNTDQAEPQTKEAYLRALQDASAAANITFVAAPEAEAQILLRSEYHENDGYYSGSDRTRDGDLMLSASVYINEYYFDVHNDGSYLQARVNQRVGYALGLNSNNPQFNYDKSWMNYNNGTYVYQALEPNELGYGVISTTYQPEDIRSLAYLYGPSTANAGNNIYDLGKAGDLPQTVADYGGIDEVTWNGPANVYLNGGATPSLIGEKAVNAVTGLSTQNAVWFSDETVIENATAKGSGDSTIVGNRANNKLTGAGGSDKLFAGAGDDTLEGGAGNDELWGTQGTNIFVYNTNDGLDKVWALGNITSRIEYDGITLDGEVTHALDEENKVIEGLYVMDMSTDSEKILFFMSLEGNKLVIQRGENYDDFYAQVPPVEGLIVPLFENGNLGITIPDEVDALYHNYLPLIQNQNGSIDSDQGVAAVNTPILNTGNTVVRVL